MARSNISQQAEKEFFIRKVGANAPINELKKQYFRSRGAVGNYLPQLETHWLQIEIAAAGGTPTGSYDSDLWKQLNAAAGFRVSQYENENKLTYYING